MAVTKLFGARVKRREDPKLLMGYGKYVDDVKLPGMLYAAFVRSPYGHAVIKDVDTSKAKNMKGVVAVITGKELEGKLPLVPCAWQIPNADLKIPPYTALAARKTRYVGDPVVIVVAEDPYVARDAAEQVEVEYEVLPAVTNPEEAAKPGAPQLYDEVPNNVAFKFVVSGGDVDSAFANADVVIKEKIINNRLIGIPLETRGAIANYDPSTSELTVWMTSQNPHIHRLLFSAVLGIPETKIRVISPDVGGGFGTKIHMHAGEIAVALVAKELGRPIKWVEDRRENMLATVHGRDHVSYVELAARSDGTILGLRVKTYANLGAYLSTAAPGVPTILYGPMLSGVYKIPAISCEVYGMLTNTIAVDAYRGAGRPEATYILERVVDVLAKKLGMDPAEVRRKNFIPKFENQQTVTGLIYDSGDYLTAFNKALEMVGYERLREEQKREREKGRLIGIGISSYVEICGMGPSKAVRATGFGLGLWESAKIRVHPTGKVSVFIGGHPHGQGEDTAFAQLVADVLGISIEDVEIHHGDTAMVPFGMGTYGSRTATVAGNAIFQCSVKVIEKGKKIAAGLLEVRPEDVDFKEGKFFVKEMPTKSVTFQEVALAAYTAEKLPEGVEPGIEETAFYDPPNFTFPFGTHVCVVEVDPETGAVKILKYVAVDDAGRVINPMLVEGQIHGGITQGLAQALYEHAIYAEDGTLLTSTLNDYLVPTAVEVPDYELAMTETPSPTNPLGVKGIGEAGTIAATPAVVNAVLDALSHLGVTHIDMPLTPEKVWSAIKAVRGG